MGWFDTTEVLQKKGQLTPAEIGGILVTWESQYTDHVAYISLAPSHDSAYSRARNYAQYWGNRQHEFLHVPELTAVADLYRSSFLTSAYYEHKKVIAKARTLTEDVWETAAVAAAAAAVIIIGPEVILGAMWDGVKAVFSPLLGAGVKAAIPEEKKTEMFPEVPPELLGDDEPGLTTYWYPGIGEKKKEKETGPGFFAGLAGLLGKAAKAGGEIFKAKAPTKRIEGIGGLVSQVGSILLILAVIAGALLLLFFLLR